MQLGTTKQTVESVSLNDLKQRVEQVDSSGSWILSTTSRNVMRKHMTLEITMNVDEAPREIIFRKPHSHGHDEYVYVLKDCARIVRD